ncbi:MAG TPA: HAMP domain-containing sensor histidine kinase [Candidatus Saccharimonadales bacterium]|nr:HAMP domain-containing sensor histidine kinase [Candidatus Saccharimonadales bacterium]
MDPAKIDPASLAEKEKYFRFEKISEIFTYLGVISALFLTTLHYIFPVNKTALYSLFAVVFVFAFIWFRLLPKKYTGLVKTLIFYYLSIFFVAIGIHFSNGVQSFALFFFYLTILSAAAALPVRYFISMIVSIAVIILIEALFFNHVPLNQSLSLAVVHIWALLIVALYGKFIFDEEKFARAAEVSDRLKVARQIDLVKNEFVFVISNKLRQPILALQNYLDSSFAAKDSSWGADFEDLLSKTRSNSQRLSRLVNDLTDLSHIENQKLSLDLKSVNLNELIGSTMSDFSMSATEKGVALKFDSNKEQIIVTADSSRLHEILANLVDNSIKYSPSPGSVTVSFVKEDRFAKVMVKDLGYGIPEEAKTHVFEKFYRVNRSASEPKGTGLGLFVTKELVERQGGKIWFESQVGKGTTFIFTLPLHKENGK